MPKSDKNLKGKGRKQPYSLAEQIAQDTAPKPPKTKPLSRLEEEEEDGEGLDALPEHLASKIYGVARQQRSEEAASAFEGLEEEEEAEEEMESGDEESEEFKETSGIQVNEEDELALAMFMKPAPASAMDAAPKKRTLGDIIAEKLAEAEESRRAAAAARSQRAKSLADGIDPRVRDMYRKVGEVLKRFTAGKLPKAFKVLPTLKNWEELLFLTRPDEWSPHAMRAAVRIFASGLNEKMAQRFYNVVLLPCVRDAIHEAKKLHFALYMALKKSLFKPMAFFKGFLLPLCESGDCTLREAIIVASVLARSSIPMLHSAACIVKIAQMPYSGANSVFLRTLLDKKYSLPFRVIDIVCSHFASFSADERKMVVLWHQALLVFVQRYKADLTQQQKDTIRKLISIHVHPLISPEIRYEIDNSETRVDAAVTAPAAPAAADVAMTH